ncbi:MAG: DUF2142 domain-containing protein [Spirochaetes bacterium]|jgi:uncharacterized membrane protein|nr:DUF2142 domain-containing protein [Spirochaetota bacterium]
MKTAIKELIKSIDLNGANRFYFSLIFLSMLFPMISVLLYFARRGGDYEYMPFKIAISILLAIVICPFYFILLKRIISFVHDHGPRIVLGDAVLFHVPFLLSAVYPFHFKISGVPVNPFLPVLWGASFFYVLMAVLIKRQSGAHSPERSFLFLAAVFGFLLVFINPPYHAPDEFSHFLRAFSIADGKIINSRMGNDIGDYLPESLVHSIASLCGNLLDNNFEAKVDLSGIIPEFSRKLDADKRYFFPFPAQALYSPVPYAPQSLIMVPCKALSFPPVVMMYLGRIFNFIAWVILMLASIRIIPVFRWPMVLIAFIPMSVYQSASLSADAVTNGLSFLAFSCLVREAASEDEVTDLKRFLGFLCIISAPLILSKNAYFIIPVTLYFLIGPARFGSMKKYLLTAALYLASCAAFLISWSLVVNKLYVPLNGSSPVDQTAFIFSDPFGYIGIILNNISIQGLSAVHTLGRMGWLSPQVRKLYLDVYLGIIALVAFFEGGKRSFMLPWRRLVFLSLVVLGIADVSTVIYLTWNLPGSSFIYGWSGRYLIPFLPSFYILFSNSRFGLIEKYGLERAWYYIILTLGSFISITSIGTLLIRFYVPAGTVPGY